MVKAIIAYSIRHKNFILLFIVALIIWGLFSISQIKIGAVPDITNNQVQVITTSRNLSTQDIEKFITYPIEIEMANLPGVKEIRSISKFGLSVVTIVFEDDMGTYLPRQLIAEKIESAKQKIPSGFGTPELGPITTGLGEIYQYTLEVEPGFKNQFNATDLRTIQDWLVKRYLSGIPGVVEVNSWGGFLKQYEVAVNPTKLKSLRISLDQIFAALERTNENTGGAYIEKGHQSFFIRGEGMIGSLNDIENTVIEVRNSIPLKISDVAQVRFGHANRYGAITSNGTGETVLGQVMMLKNANSNKVIESVKQRVNELENLLPEGVYVNPFLERSELIGRTTTTIVENLAMGALIVVLVVVLLLGNIRSGLIVASIIPISLLFSIALMNQFGIAANLMSLGAIDFGIIIDGAVIIVEFTLFQIVTKGNNYSSLNDMEKKAFKDGVALDSSTRMMKSAIFGQIIILIVFIPILTLSDIEGKLFRPMALSFSFALIGAIVLCLTYVPAMSALFLNPNSSQWRFSQSFIKWLTTTYKPVLEKALKYRVLVIGTAASLLIAAGIIFTRIGGEFIPTLDEGDFVIQPILRPGTSLSETVNLHTQMEQILLENFPEVDQAVTRIGAAEIPTDPMSMEMTDLILTLNPKETWINAETKDELADKMKDALAVIPGVEYEFTQPIEMRFNELITGVRADVAIKIYGENLDTLYSHALNVRALVEDVEGVADISVERIVGLPQMLVTYDRKQLAKYGLLISDLNRVIRMAFGGETAGSVFEGEKHFSLVVRFDESGRKNIESLKNLYITLNNGSMLPLSEVAQATYEYGPAQISRDDTRRRIVVGINVRNRDVESLVTEIQKIINGNVVLPQGYFVKYGGQFENLRNAKARLSVAVPIALFLIFIMLFFTFRSLHQTFMVYVAIPMAAIGGVALLWIRGMPFSISAGVGFIALFGIAVLNGIVLIEYLNELKKDGMDNIRARILFGATRRLRPVLLTASAAALGFFPMAFSTGAGAEVQRPLATVVIGGLISSTILTMVVLPVIYSYVEVAMDKRRMKNPKGKSMKGLSLFILLIISSFSLQAQSIDLDTSIKLALENNNELKAFELEFESQKALEKSSFDLGKTGFYYDYDENNISTDDEIVYSLGISQSFAFPTYYARQSELLKERSQAKFYLARSKELEIKNEVSKAYVTVLYFRSRLQWLNQLDSLMDALNSSMELRYELGDTDLLETLTVSVSYGRLKIEKFQVENALEISYEKLWAIVQNNKHNEIDDQYLFKLTIKDPPDVQSHPVAMYYNRVKQSYIAGNRLLRSEYLPDLDLEYYRGFEVNGPNTFPGYTIGLSFPLIFNAQKARVQSNAIMIETADRSINNAQIILQSIRKQLLDEVQNYQQVLQYYEENGLPQAFLLAEAAEKSFNSGSFDFPSLIIALQQSIEMQQEYLENLYQYNLRAIDIMYMKYPADSF